MKYFYKVSLLLTLIYGILASAIPTKEDDHAKRVIEKVVNVNSF